MGRLIFVAGSIAANYGNGGIAWERLSWILGVRRLGFDVVVVDQLDQSRTVHPTSDAHGYGGCLNLEYCRRIAKRFGFEDRIGIVGDDGESLSGLSYEALLDLASEAELLINQAGNLRIDQLKARVPRRAYVDLDPAFTQLWMASGRAAPRVAGHNSHFTIGANVATARSPLPDAGIDWRHTRQPVLLSEWPVAEDYAPGRLTNIARWRGVGPHGSLQDIGHSFPDKADYFMRLRDLPSKVPQEVEVALATKAEHGAEIKVLSEHGWRLVSPELVADVSDFRAYVSSSGGAISIAKGAYVETRSGWFSDRDTRYLSAGLPVVAQDTGFGTELPVGEGLFAFCDLEEASDAARQIAADPETHRRAARAIAEEYFDSDKVLSRLIEEAMA